MWLISLNDRRGTEGTFSLVARSVHAGQRPVFCKKDFSPKPPSSMTRWSRLKPLLQKDGLCRKGLSPRTSVFDEARIATKDAPTQPCLPHRFSLPSLGHRFTQSHGRLPTSIPISDHWKRRAIRILRTRGSTGVGGGVGIN